MLRSFLYSKRIIVMVLAIVLLCFPEFPNAQQKTTNPVSRPKLYMCITNDLNSNLKAYFKSKHVKTLKLITSLNFDPKNRFQINEDLFVKKIKELYPDPNSKEIGIIDWEGKAYEQLKSLPANDVKFKKLEQLYIKLIQLAKHTRPKMKWGFFGLPFKQHLERD